MERQQQNHDGNQDARAVIASQPADALQKELDSLMDVLEEVKGQIPEGEYLRGMNALCSIHKQKRTSLSAAGRHGGILSSWKTLDEILEDDEDLYDEIMDVADDIVMELCGEDSLHLRRYYT